MSSSTRRELSFADLGLPVTILETLDRVGYENPSPIQEQTIPQLIKGHDVIGMAQTGTGKTAAFALPLLARLDLSKPETQVLVLCPTRELAIQVAEAFQTYAGGLRGFNVLPIYGGQDIQRQLRALRKAPQVIVGTPGRLLDHLKRKTLDLSSLRSLVLDEADEMLRMGFIDDVEMILKKTPPKRQVALFSATMPGPIRKVAERYLNEPREIRIESSATTNADIEQYYWLVSGTSKLDALTRFLEVEDFDGMIVFTRTKTATVELADRLNARGFSAAPLNGDMNQALRQRTVEQLKRGDLDILVATDVAARGLDVDRISHVLNYDIPYDDEAYVHRIGRTGRAGRSGKAILFVAPRERRLLASIEKTTRGKLARMELPTRDELLLKRSTAFKVGIGQAIEELRNGGAAESHDFFEKIVEELCREHDCGPERVAAAMAWLLQKDRPLDPRPARKSRSPVPATGENHSGPGAAGQNRITPAQGPGKSLGNSPGKNRDDRVPAGESPDGGRRRPHQVPTDRARPLRDHPDVPMERFLVHVGHQDKVTPREIVGAVANEAGIEGQYIGQIGIYDEYSTIDLPSGMPDEVFQTLKKTRVCNRPLQIEYIKAQKKVRPARAGSDAESAKPKARKPRADKTDRTRKTKVKSKRVDKNKGKRRV